MRALLAFTAGILATLLAATYVLPQQTVYETQVILETVTVTDAIDLEATLERLRDVSQASDQIDDQLLADCLWAIVDQTDEPLMGVVYYLERYWQGDSCAALDHLLTHDWY
jgi:hypothetical protein